MEKTILDNEASIRLGVFLGAFAVMALWEGVAPRRRLSMTRAARWSANLAIAAINALLIRLILPAAAVGMAYFVQQNGWGLFNTVDLPLWLEVIFAVALLDMAIYFQHLVFHHIGWLWRLHRVHHVDLDFDVTTGIRFHPVEIALSMAIKFFVIAAIGAPAIAVLIFETLLNTTSLFNHGNVRIPLRADGLIRLLIVTPDMHRVHHSVLEHEHNSNFGFNLSVWDRIFGTYRAQPEAGHQGMEIGMLSYHKPADNALGRMLLIPFLGK
ncbi:MAG: sterol desaturase family protein [Nitrospinota bacterium]|nr:sterol desaturase family protein [Nitrospinota bacterium]